MNQRETRDQEIIRDLLVHIDEGEGVSQRDLAHELGIALGLTNAYIRRCVRKGLIKISQVPARRYRYYLTPQGFAEKTRLTAQFFSNSLTFFRQARSQLSELFEDCEKKGWRRVGLYGHSELAEIALLCHSDYGIAVAGIVDTHHAPGKLRGTPVVADLAALGPVDALLITDLKDPQGSYERLLETIEPERIVTAPILRILRKRNGAPSVDGPGSGRP